jgi:hypothetical protein
MGGPRIADSGGRPIRPEAGGGRTPHDADKVDFLLMVGDSLVETSLPGPVGLLDPPPPLAPLPDFRGAVRSALAAPLALPPVAKLVGRGSRVTIAFDDPCLPLPPPLFDPRVVMIEEVTAALLAAGVRADDLTFVCANGLHRRWSRAELLPLVGPRIMARFAAQLDCYDAEDPAANVHLGRTFSGLEVEVGRVVADADLVVYVAVPWTEMNGGHKSLACGLSTYRCIRQHHGPQTQVRSPLMHPEASEMHAALRDIGRHIGSHVPVLQVETVLNDRLWAGPLRLLDLRRRRLSPWLRPATRLPRSVLRLMGKGLRGCYQPVGVWAGAVEAVHANVLARQRQMWLTGQGQADILVLGLPDHSPYSVHSTMNPLLAANLGLGYAFQFGRRHPLVRPGGTVVLASPCTPGFHPRHHEAYRRFWHEVLPQTRDAARMAAEFEPIFASDPALIAAYRHDRAYHPTHPFLAWYWMSRAQAHVGDIMFAGVDDPGTVAAMGFGAAPSVEAAVAGARDRLGADATVAVMTMPPVFIVDVAP